jgi:hypothetical protein
MKDTLSSWRDEKDNEAVDSDEKTSSRGGPSLGGDGKEDS